MLAYVFWHVPASTDVAAYESALRAFHERLAPADIAGFRGSQAFRVEGATWIAAPVAYEDWYLVDDFAALGVLNAMAVAGPRLGAHDRVAGMVAEGTAGVYALRDGPEHAADAGRATWFGKPPGLGYERFLDRRDERGPLWQRQMVLGPTPEFCSFDEPEPPAGAVSVTRVNRIEVVPLR